MEHCPICESIRPASDKTCNCGYDFSKKEIVDDNLRPEANVEKIRFYYSTVKKPKYWKKELKFKKRITQVQGDKYGLVGPGTFAPYKWSEKKTAQLLDERNNVTSPDIRLAEAIMLAEASESSHYSELLECRNKSAAHARFKELKSDDIFVRLLKPFSKEKELQDYLVKNWQEISDFKNWDLKKDKFKFEVIEKSGKKLKQEIDLLAYDPKNSEWIIIELKKGFSPDRTVGQLQTYMGWINENYAGKGEKVAGLIISGYPPDIRIKYALLRTQDIQYKVYFLLNDGFLLSDSEDAFSLSKLDEDDL